MALSAWASQRPVFLNYTFEMAEESMIDQSPTIKYTIKP